MIEWAAALPHCARPFTGTSELMAAGGAERAPQGRRGLGQPRAAARAAPVQGAPRARGLGRKGEGDAFWLSCAARRASWLMVGLMAGCAWHAQVVVVLLAELAVLPIAHGYFLHVCALPLMPGQPQLSFGLSYILIHWLLGMVRTFTAMSDGAAHSGPLSDGAYHIVDLSWAELLSLWLPCRAS